MFTTAYIEKVMIKNQIHNVPVKAKFGHFWTYFDDSNTLLVEVLKVTLFGLCHVYKGNFTSIMYPWARSHPQCTPQGLLVIHSLQ